MGAFPAWTGAVRSRWRERRHRRGKTQPVKALGIPPREQIEQCRSHGVEGEVVGSIRPSNEGCGYRNRPHEDVAQGVGDVVQNIEEQYDFGVVGQTMGGG